MSKEEYVELFGVASERGSAFEILEKWLSQKFWNFDLGWNQFDGHSEGLCILAGIDIERSDHDSSLYRPEFLPGSFEFYGFESITNENQWHLKEIVDHRVDDLKSLGLKGRVHCHKAIKRAVDLDLAPPWLESANNDLVCACHLPAALRTNDGIREQLKRKAASAGGRSRAGKNLKTQCINAQGRQVFEELANNGFLDCRAKSSNKPMATRIADRIYRSFLDDGTVDDTHLPSILTIQENVRKWLKEKSRSAKN